MSWHQTIVVGNLGGDPEMQYLPSGTPVCNFNMAVNESWTDRQTNERREKTTWYRISAFGRLAEICNQYLSKGRQVMIVGTVEADAYTTNDGEARASLNLRAREVQFLQGGNGGSRGGGNRSSGGGQNRRSNNSGGGNYDDNYSPPPEDVDDIPF
jgi:single-strand DNA-binding protein